MRDVLTIDDLYAALDAISTPVATAFVVHPDVETLFVRVLRQHNVPEIRRVDPLGLCTGIPIRTDDTVARNVVRIDMSDGTSTQHEWWTLPPAVCAGLGVEPEAGG